MVSKFSVATRQVAEFLHVTASAAASTRHAGFYYIACVGTGVCRHVFFVCVCLGRVCVHVRQANWNECDECAGKVNYVNPNKCKKRRCPFKCSKVGLSAFKDTRRQTKDFFNISVKSPRRQSDEKHSRLKGWVPSPYFKYN